MDENEAKGWIFDRFGEAGLTAMRCIVEAVRTESTRQNLVARSTLDTIWSRHIVDSAQLISLARAGGDALWLDIGSGAGFPGLVVGALRSEEGRTTLVEPRKRRCDFLSSVVDALGIGARTQVVCGKIETVKLPAQVISARAVADLGDLFAWGESCASSRTRWVLPKGRSAMSEVERAKEIWHGTFHVEHSLTDPDSLIVIASGVVRR